MLAAFQITWSPPVEGRVPAAVAEWLPNVHRVGQHGFSSLVLVRVAVDACHWRCAEPVRAEMPALAAAVSWDAPKSLAVIYS